MIIIASKPGQLGNSLFLFAHFIALAIEKSDHEPCRIMNPAFYQYSNYFESTVNHLLSPYPQPERRLLKIRNTFSKKIAYGLSFYVARILYKLKINNAFAKCIYLDSDQDFELSVGNTALQGRFVFVQGWKFRNPEYFKKHKDKIKSFFKPTEFHGMYINEVIVKAKKDCDLLIGIHVRRGDYRIFEGGKYYYSLSQYKKIMHKVIGLFPQKKIHFLLCTNSRAGMEVFYDMDVVRGTKYDIEDMYAFAQCDYLVGPPSTFTMWASFYGSVPLFQVHDAEAVFTVEDFKVTGS